LFLVFRQNAGKIWPKEDVKRRRYRLRLLNGCDSRFLVIKLLKVAAGATSTTEGEEVPYTIVGTDQGLLDQPVSGQTSTVIETGARLDIVVDFSVFQPGTRLILANLGGDEPFTGKIPGLPVFAYTDMIMAFDVDHGSSVATPIPSWNFAPEVLVANRLRRVGLFEGLDEFGRLQPLLGGELTPNVSNIGRN
jgi:spore coat protein A, manganese oxidase